MSKVNKMLAFTFSVEDGRKKKKKTRKVNLCDGKMGMVPTEKKKWRKQNGAGVGEIYNVRLSN